VSFVFIYAQFNDVICSLDYIAYTNGRVIRRVWKESVVDEYEVAQSVGHGLRGLGSNLAGANFSVYIHL
jgi:hypothetical protein